MSYNQTYGKINKRRDRDNTWRDRKREMYDFLDELRGDGRIMTAAGISELQREFGLKRTEARRVLERWFRSTADAGKY
tara:strand:- start:275 stop:508 length:234 start_codon:yes stop_codon:yes gene_type:complete